MTTRLAAIVLPAALLLAPALASAQPVPGQPDQNPSPAPYQAPPYPAGTQYQPGEPPARGMSRQDFVAHAAQLAGQRFDEMDANHDGVVTPQERMAYWRAHRPNGAGAPITVHAAPPTQ